MAWSSGRVGTGGREDDGFWLLPGSCLEEPTLVGEEAASGRSALLAGWFGASERDTEHAKNLSFCMPSTYLCLA